MLFDKVSTNSVLGILCPALKAIKFGKIRVSGRKPGDRADYSCNAGYDLMGVGWRKCQDSGKWTGEAPSCKGE